MAVLPSCRLRSSYDEIALVGLSTSTRRSHDVTRMPGIYRPQCSCSLPRQRDARAFLCESWLCKATRFASGEVPNLDQPTDGVSEGLP